MILRQTIGIHLTKSIRWGENRRDILVRCWAISTIVPLPTIDSDLKGVDEFVKTKSERTFSGTTIPKSAGILDAKSSSERKLNKFNRVAPWPRRVARKGGQRSLPKLSMDSTVVILDLRLGADCTQPNTLLLIKFNSNSNEKYIRKVHYKFEILECN